MFKSMSINLLKKKTDLLSQSQSFSDPVGIRTQDPQLRRLLLYPAELPNHRFCECKDINFIDICVKKYLFFILILSRYKSMKKAAMSVSVLKLCRCYSELFCYFKYDFHDIGIVDDAGKVFFLWTISENGYHKRGVAAC